MIGFPASLLLWSCSDLLKTDNIADTYKAGQTRNHTIPLEEALVNLAVFNKDDATKSEEKTIENIITVTMDGIGAVTKSSEETPLMYVINYADNAGYAILSADRRIDVNVLAFTEQGNITEDMINGQDTLSSERLLPYILTRNYAAMGVINPIYDTTTDDIHILPPPIDIGDLIGITDTSDIPDGEWIVTIWDEVETVNAVPIMLKTKWHQWAPFNNLCGKYAAECTAVAMMQIMAYNCYPDPFKVGDFTIPFEELREMASVPNDGSTYAYNVALLTKSIWDYCGDHHFDDLLFDPDNTSTLIWPKHAEKYFKNVIGYKNVKRYADRKTCDTDMIVDCLKKGYPVFVSAKANSFNAHSWVVDGLMVKNQSGHKEGEESGIFRGEVFKTIRYMHCNWGWGGRDDGYFLEGVFDTDLSYNFDYMTKSIPDSDGDYDSYYRIITYEIPEE